MIECKITHLSNRLMKLSKKELVALLIDLDYKEEEE
jgi:hypothetical protein